MDVRETHRDLGTEAHEGGRKGQIAAHLVCEGVNRTRGVENDEDEDGSDALD